MLEDSLLLVLPLFLLFLVLLLLPPKPFPVACQGPELACSKCRLGASCILPPDAPNCFIEGAAFLRASAAAVATTTARGTHAPAHSNTTSGTTSPFAAKELRPWASQVRSLLQQEAEGGIVKPLCLQPFNTVDSFGVGMPIISFASENILGASLMKKYFRQSSNKGWTHTFHAAPIVESTACVMRTDSVDEGWMLQACGGEGTMAAYRLQSWRARSQILDPQLL